jgi:hypothetical protein
MITVGDVVETVEVTVEIEVVVVIVEDTVGDIAVHLTVVMVIEAEAVTGEAEAVEAAVMNELPMKLDQVIAAVQMNTTEDQEVMIGMEHPHRRNVREDMNRNFGATEVLPLVVHHHQIIMRSVLA